MRYPTRGSLAIPVEELGYSRLETPIRKQTSNHHLQFERRRYEKEPYMRVFRGLLDRVPIMWVPEHVDLHDRYSAPIMPSKFTMIDTVEEYLAINGVIDVVCEHRTNEQYQLTQQQWDRIIGRK